MNKMNALFQKREKNMFEKWQKLNNITCAKFLKYDFKNPCKTGNF